jgi:hypothetical protein
MGNDNPVTQRVMDVTAVVSSRARYSSTGYLHASIPVRMAGLAWSCAKLIVAQRPACGRPVVWCGVVAVSVRQAFQFQWCFDITWQSQY